MKPRTTKLVREGWDEHIRPMIACILENGDEAVFECRDPMSKSAEVCKCDGCKAIRAAWAAVAWIDARI